MWNGNFTIFDRNGFDPSSIRVRGDTITYDLPGLYIKASEACTSGWVSIKSCRRAGRQSYQHCVVVVERVCTAEREKTIEG
jgi:hypothetical protein